MEPTRHTELLAPASLRRRSLVSVPRIDASGESVVAVAGSSMNRPAIHCRPVPGRSEEVKKTARSVDSANEQVESIEGKHVRDYEAAFPVATFLIMSLREKALLHKYAIEKKQVEAETALAQRRELYR